MGRTVAWILLLSGLGIAGCGLGEADNYAPLTATDNFRVIEADRAYRSAQLDAESLRLVIDEHKIKTIINLRGVNESNYWYQQERAVTEETGVVLANVRMSANAMPSRDTLLLLYDTLTTAEHPVLIHCKSGADRTGAAAAIWRMVVNGEPKTEAQRELSPLYGHFAMATPDMDRLVNLFQPSREWILNEYPVP